MKNQKKQSVKLPHGATLDDDGVICLPLGDISVLKFVLEEWSAFYEIIDDINIVIQANTVEGIIQCPTCNTIESYIKYEEPCDEEIN